MCIGLSWVVNNEKLASTLHANLTSTKVSASYRKSIQVNPRLGQKELNRAIRFLNIIKMQVFAFAKQTTESVIWAYI